MTIRSLVALAVAASVPVSVASASLENWRITMTVDNQYDLYFGTPTATSAYVGGDTDWFTAETYVVTGRASTDYLYVTTSSDRFVAQGFLGEFVNLTTGNTVLTGDAQFQVFRAGDHLQALFGMTPGTWPADLQPTVAQTDAAIAYATANNLWTAAATGGQVNAPGVSPWFPFASISSAAQWVWSPTTNGSNPLRPGADHGEFLVFRIAGAAIPTPGAAALLGLAGLAATRRRRA
jgi:MYXO-CTERM domain-containing protein